jgi:hypothetical protein
LTEYKFGVISYTYDQHSSSLRYQNPIFTIGFITSIWRQRSRYIMVLRELRTDALEGLCTDEQLELLNSIDSLRSQGISHYVSLPQIIVCGDQSSGKSSVLEAISGVSFPVRSSLCTRFPTELVLRKHSQSGVRVSIGSHQSRSELEQNRLSSFG